MFCNTGVVILSLIKLSFIALIASVLTGCGYIYGENGLIKNQEYTYVNAKQSKDLKIPTTLSHKSSANYTVLPKLGNKAENHSLGKNLKQSAPVQLLAVLDNTRVDKKSLIPSVLIIDDLEFIWITARMFLDQHQVMSEVNEVAGKVILTKWLALENAGVIIDLDGEEEPDLNRVKYKISINDGEVKGEYNLSVERVFNQYRESDDNQWLDKKSSWSESADMMNLLLGFYDQRIRQKSANHQQQIMAGFKVVLGQNEKSEAALVTAADEKLVWEKIPRVMRELGLKVIDKDLRQKTYFMEYEIKEPGFFASLFNETNSKLPLEAGTYQLTITEAGEQRALTIRDGQGTALEANLLVKLFPELSRLFGDRR
jgi:outer membrane protein assembly factor BamC